MSMGAAPGTRARNNAGCWAESTGWAGLAYDCWRLAKSCWRNIGVNHAERPRALSVAARLDFGPKRSLLVVAFEEQRFLVGMGSETISTVIEIAPSRIREIALPVLGSVR